MSSWVTVQFPGGGVILTVVFGTGLGIVSGAIGDTKFSASAGVLLGISSVETGVDWTGISTVSEGSPDWTGVSALINELPIEQVDVVEKSSKDKHENCGETVSNRSESIYLSSESPGNCLSRCKRMEVMYWG